MLEGNSLSLSNPAKTIPVKLLTNFSQIKNLMKFSMKIS